MDSKHRFNRDEISAILKRAAELEHKNNIDDESDGLTIEELQQVFNEVGIHPKYIQKAVNELQNPAQPAASNLFGGPFTYHFSDTVSGTFSEEEWEEIVSEIRRIHGGIGKTSKLGTAFEWEQRKKEVGYIQLSLFPKKDHTKIRINASYNYFAKVIYGVTGILGFMLVSVLLKKLDFPLVPSVIMSAVGVLALIGGARFYLSRWMKKKRKTYARLFEHFQKMLARDEEINLAPSIEISESPQHKVENQNISSKQQKTS